MYFLQLAVYPQRGQGYKGFLQVLAVFDVFDRIINIERTDVTSPFFDSLLYSRSLTDTQNFIL